MVGGCDLNVQCSPRKAINKAPKQWPNAPSKTIEVQIMGNEQKKSGANQ